MNEAALPPPIPSIARPLQDAPGYKGAKICGILAILFAITCVGFPVAIVLGIIALVKQGKAKRLAREAPDTYRMPSSGAMIMGIVALGLVALSIPVAGIGAAVAIPAFMMQRDKARTAVLQQNLQTVRMRAEEVLMETGGVPADQLAQTLLGDPAITGLKNPFDPKAPALELAETPSQNGTIALWPTVVENQAKLLLAATYLQNREVMQFNEEVIVASMEVPAPVPEEVPQEETPEETTP